MLSILWRSFPAVQAAWTCKRECGITGGTLLTTHHRARRCGRCFPTITNSCPVWVKKGPVVNVVGRGSGNVPNGRWAQNGQFQLRGGGSWLEGSGTSWRLCLMECTAGSIAEHKKRNRGRKFKHRRPNDLQEPVKQRVPHTITRTGNLCRIREHSRRQCGEQNTVKLAR